MTTTALWRDLESVVTLSRAEAESFWRNGFVGPFPVGIDADWSGLAERCADIVTNRTKQPLYRRYAVRDWHLVDPDLEQVLTAPAIADRVSDILGNDLLLWRSKIFCKMPHDDPIGWHQEWGFFDGEEIGNAVPSLQPVNPDGELWNVTVWVAFDEITLENGPLQLARGTHRTRVPWQRVPMTESAFFESPFKDLDRDEVIRRTRSGELILDIDTSEWLDELDVSSMATEEICAHLLQRLAAQTAKSTEFEPASDQLASMTMPPGHFVIFSERTMHGSPANNSPRRRCAVNCRYTRSDTLVYPFRLSGDRIDGSNLDVTNHESLLVRGELIESRNVVRSVLG